MARLPRFATLSGQMCHARPDAAETALSFRKALSHRLLRDHLCQIHCFHLIHLTSLSNHEIVQHSLLSRTGGTHLAVGVPLAIGHISSRRFARKFLAVTGSASYSVFAKGNCSRFGARKDSARWTRAGPAQRAVPHPAGPSPPLIFADGKSGCR